MIKLSLMLSLIVPILCLMWVVRSARISKDLRRPLILMLAAMLASGIVQTMSISGQSVQVVSTYSAILPLVVIAAGLFHFLTSLGAPRFVKNSGYWILQAAVSVAMLLAIGALYAQPNSRDALHVVMGFFPFAVVMTGCAVLLLEIVHTIRHPLTDLQRFRARSALSLLMWSLVLSALLFLSLPVAPGVATASATAAWCTSFAAVGTRYSIEERRLFLNDCARRAVAEIGSRLSPETISMAANSIDTLGLLLGGKSSQAPHHPNDIAYRPSQEAGWLNANRSTPLLLSGASQDEAAQRIQALSELDSEQMFERLLSSPTDNDFIIPLAAVRPALEHQLWLSRHFFDSELVGCSDRFMEIVAQLRELGEDPRPVIFSGEVGTGKKLLSLALHRARRTEQLHDIYFRDNSLSQVRDEIVQALGTGSAPREHKTVRIHLGASIDRNTLRQLGELCSGLPCHDLMFIADSELSKANDAGLLALASAVDATLVRIPALRERLEDVLYQSLWQIDRVGKQRGLEIVGVEARALREVLISRWGLNTQELLDSVTLAVSVGGQGATGIVSSFILPDPLLEPHQQPPAVAKLGFELEKLFVDSQLQSETIAERLGVSLDFVQVIAKRFKIDSHQQPQIVV